MAPSTPMAAKKDKFTKCNLVRELKTGVARNSKIALDRKKIQANLEQLKAHFAATGDGQSIDDILDKVHPTVQNVYQLLQDQTKTIVAAIDSRADLTDAKIDLTSARLVRIMTGQTSIEDNKGLTYQQTLAQNCQAVRALQSQNIQLRADIKGGLEDPAMIDEKAKKLEDTLKKKAAKMADLLTKKANIAQKKADLAQKRAETRAEKEKNKVLKTSLKKPTQKTKLTSYFKPVDKEADEMEEEVEKEEEAEKEVEAEEVEEEAEEEVRQEVTGECEAVSRLFM